MPRWIRQMRTSICCHGWAEARQDEFGEELAMPFTSEVANQALIQEVALRGGDVTNIAKDLSAYGKKVMRLPEMMVLSKKMKLDGAAIRRSVGRRWRHGELRLASRGQASSRTRWAVGLFV